MLSPALHHGSSCWPVYCSTNKEHAGFTVGNYSVTLNSFTHKAPKCTEIFPCVGVWVGGWRWVGVCGGVGGLMGGGVCG